MQRVHFVGGVFIYAKDPKPLADWYAEHLGIETVVEGTAYYREFMYRRIDDPERTARTTWAIMQAKEELPDVKTGMVNYAVDDLEELLDQLRLEKVDIEKVEEYDYGKFAWIVDPEGNRIELFEDKEY